MGVGGRAGRILMIFLAVPHETEEMVKISPMARLGATFAVQFWPKCDLFFGGALFFIWGHQLATFLDQPAMLEENLSQKKNRAPPNNPKIWLKTCPGGSKNWSIFFVTVLSKRR